jgi:hypothetical protein
MITTVVFKLLFVWNLNCFLGGAPSSKGSGEFANPISSGGSRNGKENCSAAVDVECVSDCLVGPADAGLSGITQMRRPNGAAILSSLRAVHYEELRKELKEII